MKTSVMIPSTVRSADFQATLDSISESMRNAPELRKHANLAAFVEEIGTIIIRTTQKHFDDDTAAVLMLLAAEMMSMLMDGNTSDIYPNTIGKPS